MHYEEPCAVRGRLLAAGYVPVPLYSHNCASIPERDRGKRPVGDDWRQRALEARETGEIVDPPHAGNTGICTDGLRAFDLDCDDPDRAEALKALTREIAGDAPTRYREGSPRLALLYRAADPAARKRAAKGPHGKVEVLGVGQQLASFGTHASGAVLQWDRDLPPIGDLPVITEAQVEQVLAAAKEVLGCPSEAAPETAPSPTTSPVLSEHHPMELRDVESAVDQLRLDGADYDVWLKVGSAIYHATNGSHEGLATWEQWSRQWPAHYEAKACSGKWRRSMLRRVTTGSLIAWAKEANPNWVSPSLQDKINQERPSRADPPKPAAPNRFQMLTFNDVDAMEEPEWLLPDILVEKSLAVMWAPSKSLKSFLAMDWALRLAFGIDLDGTPQKPRRVLYISAEGQSGLRRRQRAWLKVHAPAGRRDAYFRWLTSEVNLIDPADVDLLITRLHEQQADQLDLIVIDTLSRCIAGAPENAPETMTSAIAAADRIRREFHSALLLIHHAGKDVGRGPRGHSALIPAVDTAVEVERHEASNTMTATIMKQKDGEDGISFQFAAVKVEVDQDRRTGKPITSLVLQRQTDAVVQLAEEAAKHNAQMADRLSLARHIKPGESQTFKDLCAAIGWTKSGPNYDRIRAAVPPDADWVGVRLSDVEVRRLRRIMVKSRGQEAEAIECAPVGKGSLP